MKSLLATTILFVATLLGASAQRPILEEKFERKRGELRQRLEKDKQLEVVKGVGVGGGSALRATYIPSKNGSERIVVRHPIKPALEYSLNYDVLFEEDFDFTHGGKLHGLGPEEPVTGGKPMRPDGWSARLMFGKDGSVRLYNYHQGLAAQYGDRGKVKKRNYRFPKGKWVSVSLHVRMNKDLKAKDGFTKLYIDGKLIEEKESLQWRASGKKDTLINQFLFSTFHGGSTEKWTPRDKNGKWTEVHALFDNIAVYPGERIRQAPGK